MDFLIAAVACVVLLPVLLAVYVAVRVTSPGPGIYRQQRVGRDGRIFEIYKFRTMHHLAPEVVHRDYVTRLLAGEIEPEHGLYKLDHDPRITRVGSVLRRTSIDELPQLWNVLRGDMSLVGPRPALPWEVEMFPAWARCRQAVPPGLTGPWQVSGRNRLTMTDGLRLDVEYVRSASTLLDIRILLLTLPALFRGGAR